MTQTVTGLFDTYEHAAQAVAELERSGVPHSDISIVASNAHDRWADRDGAVSDTTANAAGTGATAGTVIGGGAGLLAGLGLLAIPGLGPIVAAGWLVATITGAGVGAAAGGLLGGLTGAGVSPEHAQVYAEGVRRGGTLVTARVPDDLATSARAILTRGAVDPDLRRTNYEQAGWTGFDPSAPAYSSSEIEQERARLAATSTGGATNTRV
jgi:hypothetical protein